MRVNEIMTGNPCCCEPEDDLICAAKLMLLNDCGSLPVVDKESQRIVGVVTDRDIAVRAVAAGRDIAALKVCEVMSHPVAVVREDQDVAECVRLLEQNQIRRAPVIDHSGRLIGIVAQADIALRGELLGGELVREVSRGPDIGHQP